MDGSGDLSRGNILRKSKRKSKPSSFVSHCKNEDQPIECYISSPTNFEKKEFTPENISPHVSIQECPFNVTGYGCLIMKDKFKLKRSLTKKKKVTVFMFEKIIVFTKEEENELYYYIGSIKMEDLSIMPSSKDAKLILTDFKRSKLTNSNVEYRLTAKTAEVAKAWMVAVQKCLWKELVIARGGFVSEPPHQNNG